MIPNIQGWLTQITVFASFRCVGQVRCEFGSSSAKTNSIILKITETRTPKLRNRLILDGGKTHKIN
jgi:hypothetical protein